MVAGEMEQGDKNFEYMYTFGAYNDDTILPANPLEVWRLYRDGSQVSGKEVKPRRVYTNILIAYTLPGLLVMAIHLFAQWLLVSSSINH